MPFEFNVVLVEPEIPQNTGSIGRLCLATGATLHLVEPLGFEITHSRLKRAGLDYWEHLKVVIHPSLEAFLKTIPENAPKVFFSKKAGHTHFEHSFLPGTYLIFGKETAGLPDWVINAFPTETVRIPMYDARVRSLNLAQAASIAVYEGIRQLSTLGLFLFLFFYSSSAFSACEDCVGLPAQTGKLVATIERLRKIIKANEDFGRSLQPDDHSEQIKVNSNLNVAKKRIALAESQIEWIQGKMKSGTCQVCFNSGTGLGTGK